MPIRPPLTPSPWHPILEGPASTVAWEVINDIRDALSTVHFSDPSPSSGKAGAALFYAHLARATEQDTDADRALALIEEAIDAFGAVEGIPFLYGGFTGIAWAVEHLQGWFLEPQEGITLEVDRILLRILKLTPVKLLCELVGGVTGLGVYALSGLPRTSAVQLLERTVLILEETAEVTREGLTWFSPPDLLSPYQKERAPNGWYNLGLPHGVPGVIALLGLVCASQDPSEARSRSILERAVPWLLAQKQNVETFGSYFPVAIGDGVQLAPTRVTWCYGDLGVALALFIAARGTGELLWEEEARRIARHCAGRPSEDITDAGLCHGAAGTAHLFNRLYQATQETIFRDTACFWYQRALEMRCPGQGIAGYRRSGNPDGKSNWSDDPGLLTGACGIALSLMAAVTNFEPSWDRMLLVSIP